MKIEDVKNICVVGAGNMGHQIALQCAISGYTVKCTDVIPEVLKKAEDFAGNYLAGQVKKGKMEETQVKEIEKRISFTPRLEEAAKDADYVIEAILERLELKRKVFAQLDEIAPAHAILATNSSYIVSSKIADATNRPSQVCNLHFFNPPLVMKLVEVVQGAHVSDETAQVSMHLCEKMGKVPIHIKKEVRGFVLNRIIAAIKREAIWMLEMGVASFEDIDKACVYGAGHPMGPFRLNDLTGLDLSYDIAMELFRETGDMSDLPSPQLVERVAKGHFGQKTGKGWYDYTQE